MVRAKPSTAAELERLPDEYRWELVRGELLELPPSSPEASAVSVTVTAHLWLHTHPHDLGALFAANTGFLLERNPDTVLAPDGAFVRADRLPPKEERAGFPPVAPDLIIEVLSPFDDIADFLSKVIFYLDAGVRLVWVVDPGERRVTAYGPGPMGRVFREGDELDGGGVLPGFRLAVAELFA